MPKPYCDDLRSGADAFDAIVRNHPHPLRVVGRSGRSLVLSPWAQDEMKRQFSLGETIHRLCARFGCAESTVSRVCGAKPRPIPPGDPMDAAVIEALADQGLGWEEIGRRLGVDPKLPRRIYFARRPVKIRLVLQR